MERFEFGENWKHFLRDITEERISAAKKSMQVLLGMDSLAGKRFLDIGSGSGLFSLAARQLGAEVVSFDYDAQAVECARTLKERYSPSQNGWTISQGSALDAAFLRSLGPFDIVYSWGVLHHTGAMWRALENAMIPVAPRGLLCVAIYNDQGWVSRFWTVVKKTYVRSPKALRFLMLLFFGAYFKVRSTLGSVIKGSSPKRERGMSAWVDLVDWIGGYPFEVAKPEAIVEFYRSKGFTPVRVNTCGRGLGCNEFHLRRAEAAKTSFLPGVIRQGR